MTAAAVVVNGDERTNNNYSNTDESTFLLPRHYNHHQDESQVAIKHHHDDDDDDDHDHTHDDSSKIGYLGSVAIAVNSLAGPAVLQLPFQYQESGLVPTTICLCLVAVLSALCSLHMANVVSCIPNNKSFSRCVEFSDAFQMFLGARFYKLTQILFFMTAVCLNTAAMVDTAQVVDSVLGLHLPMGSVAIDVGNIMSTALWSDRQQYNDFQQLNETTTFISSSSPLPILVEWAHPRPCTRRQVKQRLCDPFASSSETSSSLLLTAGYIITAIVFLPICLMDLKENTNWQIGGFLLTMTLCLFFCIQFAMVSWQQVARADAQYELALNASHYDHSLHKPRYYSTASILTHNAPLFGSTYTNMIGVILFNFTLVLALPAWLHEKKRHVQVHKVVGGATLISTVLYISVGALAAVAIPNANVNMLSPMVAGTFGSSMAVAGSLFSFFIIGLDIPLFCVLARYNLTHSGLCSERTANLLVVWIPWSVAWVLYQGDAVGELLQWGGTFLTSAVAFLLPLFLALVVLTTTDRVGALRVYGNKLWLSRNSQINALYCLFYLTVMAVFLAIGGEIASTGDLDEYLQSEAYLNESSWNIDWAGMALDMAVGE
ncbi:hypothetical protein MPSEU_000201500 [Mayamaea pseudoterrestris]|nr:hypothetical protein MPSEU_000201500 [Mayamaea pseudoterrestris]